MAVRSLDNVFKAEERRRLSRKASAAPSVLPSARHLVKGRLGEEVAADFLAKKGYVIIDRNVHEGHCEIDIVARDKDEIVFAEVRTRKFGAVTSACESVGPQKLSKLITAGRRWAESRHYEGIWRIDLVAVTEMNDGTFETEHLRDITEPIV
ncbi:MAG: YraN family protein [Synergistes sp.]|nr:YraN family protein [Synergistes sp.]